MFLLSTEAEIRSLLSNPDIRTAQEKETKSRIYRQIHTGTVSDHLMPVESRAYWRGLDRLWKIAIWILLTPFVYLFLVMAPSVLYRVLCPLDALSQTYAGPLAALTRDKHFRSEISRSFADTIPEQELKKRFAGVITIKSFSELLKFSEDRIKEKPELIPLQFRSTPWLLSEDPWALSAPAQRITAASFTLFTELLRKEPAKFDDFLKKHKIVVTPWNNWLEIGTQVNIIIILCFLLTVYFSRKIDFFDVLRDCEAMNRPFATIDCSNVLGTIFRGRRHLHYFFSIFVALVATCVHFYYIGETNLRVVRPFTEVVGLVPYDYRLATELQPVFIVHWSVQFFLVFLFVLLCYEVGILGKCLQRVQRHLAIAGWIHMVDDDNRGAKERWENLVGKQRSARLLMFGSCAPLLVMGYLKYVDAASSGVFSGTTWRDWGVADYFRMGYFFSPLLSALLLIYLATPQVYGTVEIARTAKTKKLVAEEDSDFISSALGSIPQLTKSIKETIKDVKEIVREIVG
jgi:hypothetical protein